MCQGLGGGGAQPHGVARPNEGNVKPERDPVYGPGLQHVELDGDLDPVEVGLVSCLEVDDVTQGLRGADVDVKSVHNGLPEVLGEGGASEGREVHAVEVFLIPEVHLTQEQKVRKSLKKGVVKSFNYYFSIKY